MNLLTNIRNAFKRDREDPETRATAAPTVADVWASPALFNRATRRRAGITGRIWKWDTRGTEMQRTFVPRYIRRNYRKVPTVSIGAFGDVYAPALTRRQRKMRSKIMRIVAQTGLA